MAKKKSKSAQKCPDPIQIRSRTAATDKKSKPAKKPKVTPVVNDVPNLPTAPPGNDQNAVVLRDLSDLPKLPFHLPRLPRDAVFKHLEIADIMSFALTSNDCRGLAKKLTIETYDLHMEYHTGPLIQIIVHPYDKLNIEAKLSVEAFQKGRPTVRFGNATVLIDRSKREYDRVNILNIICQHESDLEYVSRLITRLILTICKTDRLFVRLLSNDIVPLDYFAGLRIKSLDWWPKQQAPVELFRAIVDNDFIDEFEFCGKQLIGNFNGFIRNKKIVVLYGGWITQEHLLNMECEEILIEDTTLSAASYRALLRAWEGGRLENLRWCRLYFKDRPRGFDCAARGLKSIKWHPPLSIICDYERNDSEDCLISNVNGKLASFVFYSNHFTLNVWSD